MVNSRVPIILLAGSAIALSLASCAAFPLSWDRRVREQQLISLARAEIAHRVLPLPPRYTPKVTESPLIIEIPPYEIDLCEVEFYDPQRKQPVPIYSVSYKRWTGEFYSFGDTRVLRYAH